MSGIMEKNLPMAEEVTSENLIRTVSEEGNSQNMTVEQLGELVGGTSLVTNKYTLNTVSMGESVQKQSAAISFDSPIALSKIRSIFVESKQANVIGGLVVFEGNLSGDQVYQIVFNFQRGFDAVMPAITFNPNIYITIEE